jgi:ribonuclease T2
MKLLTILSLALALACPIWPQNAGKPGQFDYYLLVLSWSPEFCHGKPGASQCQEHRNFVLHGLWPQYNDGSYPSGCRTTQPPPTDLAKIEQIMPAEIVAHEWQKHGTCSGLSGDAYFRLAQALFASVKIPADFIAPTQTTTSRPATLKKDFESANPILADEDIAIQLQQGYLNAVEICFSKGDHPAPTACVHIHDVSGGTFRVPPVQ